MRLKERQSRDLLEVHGRVEDAACVVSQADGNDNYAGGHSVAGGGDEFEARLASGVE